MLKKTSLVITLLFISLFAFSQTEIYGAWDVHCGVESSGLKTTKTCALCPVSSSDTAVKIKGFTLQVDSAHLQFGNAKDKISYVRRPSGKAISFVKDRQPYSFDIVATTSPDYVILRSNDGTLLILQRRLESEESAATEE